MPERFASDLTTNDNAEALLDELELRCQNDLTSARDLATQRTRVATTIRPGNLIDRQGFLLATTTELRRGGALCLAAQPLMVGSIFHLAFDRTLTELGARLAVCDRCTMLGEASFELRFQFVQTIGLDQPTPGTDER